MADLPEILRRQRALLAMTQTDLAKATGLGVRQIARYESGEQEPSLERARLLAEALHMTLDELAGATKTTVELAWDDVLVATTRMATAWAQWQEALDRYAAAKRNQ